ncbi:iron-containing alcohol dehydrogenase [Ruminococcaceae bacterium OttesenSCG-928-A16]|nr:iron-containing alcohol dehydrogenase [Ruminococcaceae bacterium OttesenSCG-928-A16]
MVNFEYYTPTRVVFGKGVEEKVGSLVKEQNGKKVLVHYGGQSAKKSGLLDRVFASLKEAGIEYVELGGVVPNPHLSLVYQGIELCKKEGVDFLLAVGGGSVIDSSKAIAYGVLGGADDVWDYYDGKATAQAALPVGAVLTIAAAGSEMSNSSVITNEKTLIKKGYNHDILGRCRFAVMNPELTLTLPEYQTACGCADIVMHTLERYFTADTTMEITDSIAEALLRTTMENARTLTREPQNYNARAEIMWAGSLSHNGLTGAGGGRGDWATHQLGHELSGLFDLAHGAALTAVWGSWARYVYKQNPARFARLALNVLELPAEGSVEELALAGIEEMENFFWGLDLPISMSEAGLNLDDEKIHELAVRCSFDGKRTVGGFKPLAQQDMEAIYKMAK